MKKVFAFILTLALLSMASVTAFAANPITSKGESDSAIVKGTYVAGGTAATVYSLDITWGSMEFTYTDASEGTWNPETHQYDNVVAAKWDCDKDANKISVTNHSNAGVTVQLSYASEPEYNKITGTFSNVELNLESAVETELLNAPSGSSILSLNGALSSSTSEKTKIGTVTVTFK